MIAFAIPHHHHHHCDTNYSKKYFCLPSGFFNQRNMQLGAKYGYLAGIILFYHRDDLRSVLNIFLFHSTILMLNSIVKIFFLFHNYIYCSTFIISALGCSPNRLCLRNFYTFYYSFILHFFLHRPIGQAKGLAKIQFKIILSFTVWRRCSTVYETFFTKESRVIKVGYPVPVGSVWVYCVWYNSGTFSIILHQTSMWRKRLDINFIFINNFI